MNLIEFTILGATELISATLETLNAHGASYPSFQRYFWPGEFEIVKRMFGRLLIFIDAEDARIPVPECDADVPALPELWLYHGDPPHPDFRNCVEDGSNAYHNELPSSVPGTPGQPFIAFCDGFFSIKLHVEYNADPNYPFVQNLGDSIDDGLSQEPEAESVSSVMLHGKLSRRFAFLGC